MRVKGCFYRRGEWCIARGSRTKEKSVTFESLRSEEGSALSPIPFSVRILLPTRDAFHTSFSRLTSSTLENKKYVHRLTDDLHHTPVY